MIAALPEPLSRAIEAEIASIPAPVLRTAAAALSGAYRGKTALDKALSPADRAAYLAVRFPSTFAVAKAAWREFARASPASGIRSVLDVGAGPGTAALASQEILDPGTCYTYLERDRGWLGPAQRLAAACNINPEIRHAALTPTQSSIATTSSSPATPSTNYRRPNAQPLSTRCGARLKRH
jgi:ribosomal protein RSM22 (predicted rRNA methylase)